MVDLLDQSDEFSLKRISGLMVGPQEAITIIRELDSAEKREHIGYSDRIYCTLESLTWKLLVCRNDSSDMTKWQYVLRQCAAWYPLANERIRVLSDLMTISTRFESTHRVQLHSKSYVVNITDVLRGNDGVLNLQQLSQKTNISEDNLLILVNKLAVLGLVKVTGYGQESVVSIQ